MVAGELSPILADVLLPVRQVNRPALRQSEIHRRDRPSATGRAATLGSSPSRARPAHQPVSDGQTLCKMSGPPALPDNVTDQLTHGPVRLGRPRRPRSAGSVHRVDPAAHTVLGGQVQSSPASLARHDQPPGPDQRAVSSHGSVRSRNLTPLVSCDSSSKAARSSAGGSSFSPCRASSSEVK
jgi:hypothetical protein